MDNDRLTVWGQSYEKEMKAHQKSETTIPSQMDISVTSMVDATKAVANKENVVPSRRVQHSIAFLEDENSELRSPEKTLLHVHPTDNLSGDDGIGGKEIFQLKSFVANVPHAIEERRPSVNDSACMEVSMIWQDILAQSKIASVRNKSIAKMGNTMDLASKDNVLVARQTIHYQADDGLMEQSIAGSIRLEINDPIHSGKDSAWVGNHQGNGAIGKQRQTIHYWAEDGRMDESVAVTEASDRPQYIENPRQTIIFNGQTGVMDESGPSAVANPAEEILDKSPQPKGLIASRQTIHFNAQTGVIDESLIASRNIHETTNFKSRLDHSKNTRQTIHFNQMSGAMDESLVRNNISTGAGEWPLEESVDVKRQQTIHFRSDEATLEETVAAVRSTKHSVYYTSSNGAMDESVQVTDHTQHEDMEVEEGPQKTPGKRGTIYFRDEHAALDVTGSTGSQLEQTVRGDGGMDPSLQNIPLAEGRQTIYYQGQDIALDVSSRHVSTIVQNVPRRGTVYYSSEQGLMEESCVMAHPKDEYLAKPVTRQPQRPTIYCQEPQQAKVDESTNVEIGKDNIREELKDQEQRHTIYDSKGMDISVRDVRNTPVFLPGGVADEETRYKATNFNRGQDVSCVVQRPSSKRGTILFNREEGGMEESILMETPKEKSFAMSGIQQQQQQTCIRPTIYYNPEQAQIDGTLMVGEATNTKPFPPRSLKLRQTIYEHGVMDISLGPNKSNINVIAPIQQITGTVPVEEPLRRQTVYYPGNEGELDVSNAPPPSNSHLLTADNVEVAPRRQTIHFSRENDSMDESIEMLGESAVSNSIAPMKEKPIGPLEFSRARAARNASLVAPMEETMIVPNIRRGTFNVPPEEARIPLKNNMMQCTIMEGESMDSDLNNFEDSIELIDSNGADVTPRISLPSPDLGNVTVHDLNLNFNVTGQILVPKEDDEEDQVRKNIDVVSKSSRIPVAKALRTPRKEMRADAISDISTVDVVCRDAIPAMSTFAELNVDEKDTQAIFRGKPDFRLSIPVFSGMQVNPLRQTMLDMNDVTEFEPDMDDEERIQQQEPEEDTVATLMHRELNIENFKNFDYGVGIRLVKNLRYKVASIFNATPVDQSVYLAKPAEEMSLRQRIMVEIEA